MMYLSYHERDIIIRALAKVLELEQQHARIDEYKKLLDRLKEEQEKVEDIILPERPHYDLDDA